MAPRVPTTIKFGIQVDFGLFCHKLLEFLKLEVINHDLREKLRLLEYMQPSNAVYRKLEVD